MNLNQKKLVEVKTAWRGCRRCPCYKTRREMVFYRGSVPCDVLFIGEAPGKDEDLMGEPFIGRAGQVLDQWIEDAKQESSIPFSFGVTNILACLPLDDQGKIRPPAKEEAAACDPRLYQTIRAADPKLIFLLGQTAKKYYKIGEELDNIGVVEVQHPAYVLRQGGIGTYAYDSNLLKIVNALETLHDKKRPKPKSQVRQSKKSGVRRLTTGRVEERARKPKVQRSVVKTIRRSELK